MLAIRQTYDSSPDMISVPKELRHRKTEVLFIALDDAAIDYAQQKQALIKLAASWHGDELIREVQATEQSRLEFD